MSDFLYYCMDTFNVWLTDIDTLIGDLNVSPIYSLFAFSRSFPFVFLCLSLTVVGILALIKKGFSGKNYI